MFLRHLRVENLRNLSALEIPSLSHVNIIYGVNGSGKTSILESLHLLSLGRPIRRSRFQPVIQYRAPIMNIFGAFSAAAESTTIPLGMERKRSGGQRFMLNGKKLTTLSELTHFLPLQIIDSEVFRLITGDPQIRREFMDWGVFHVKHNFGALWSQCRRCRRQRNILLHQPSINKIELEVWSKEFSQCSELLDNLRQEWFADFKLIFIEVLKALLPEPIIASLTLTYYRGWREQPLLECLHADRTTEQKLKYTRFGPHRADLLFKIEGYAAAAVLSRGQMKLLTAALKIAQSYYLYQNTNKASLLLIDDLTAELDNESQMRLCKLLHTYKGQLFISCIDPSYLRELWADAPSSQMFHVKHGKIAL